MEIHCTKCKKWLEDNEENFRFYKSGKRFGKRTCSICKICQSLRKKEWKKENKEKIKEKAKKY